MKPRACLLLRPSQSLSEAHTAKAKYAKKAKFAKAKVFAGAKRQKQKLLPAKKGAIWQKAKWAKKAKRAKRAIARRDFESAKLDPKCYAACEVLTRVHLVFSLLQAKAKTFSRHK